MYRQRRPGRNPYVVLLLAQLAQQVWQLEDKPPVTIALVAINLLIHFGGSELQASGHIPSIWQGCLQPRLILKGGQWWRLIWSAFLHADDWHVYYNMSSLVWKGVQLERRYGPLRFSGLVAELLLLSNGIALLLSVGLATYVPEYRYLYDTCAVGFSAVLFGLKVVLNHDSPGYSQVMGLTLPTKYLCWAELLLASYVSPNASFLGHLAGILAGLTHVRLLGPAARRAGAIGRRLRNQLVGAGFGGLRFRGGGRLGGGEGVVGGQYAYSSGGVSVGGRGSGAGAFAGFSHSGLGAGTHRSVGPRGLHGPRSAAAEGRASGAEQRGGTDQVSSVERDEDALGGSGAGRPTGGRSGPPLDVEELRRRRLERFR